MSTLKGLKEKQETGKQELSWEETTWSDQSTLKVIFTVFHVQWLQRRAQVKWLFMDWQSSINSLTTINFWGSIKRDLCRPSGDNHRNQNIWGTFVNCLINIQEELSRQIHRVADTDFVGSWQHRIIHINVFPLGILKEFWKAKRRNGHIYLERELPGTKMWNIKEHFMAAW